MPVSVNQKIFVNLILTNGNIVPVNSLNFKTFNRDKIQSIVQAIAPCLDNDIADVHILEGFKLSVL